MQHFHRQTVNGEEIPPSEDNVVETLGNRTLNAQKFEPEEITDNFEVESVCSDIFPVSETESEDSGTNNKDLALQSSSKGFKFSSGTISETSDVTIQNSTVSLMSIVAKHCGVRSVAAESNQAREINARRKKHTSTRTNQKNGE